MFGRILSSQSRSITVWQYEPNLISYVIPMYSGLESCLGSNLEIVLDLRKSYQYQQSYRRIANIPLKTELLNVPQFQTPLLLDLSCKKITHKTVVFGREYLQEQQLLEKKQDELDYFYGTELSSGKTQEIFLK